MRLLPRSLKAPFNQTRHNLTTSEEYLSYDLSKAVQELPPLYTHLVAGSLIAFCCAIAAWTGFSKIDEVAIADGQITPLQPVQPMQADISGRIRKVNVVQGQSVQKGEPILELDNEQSAQEVKKQNAVLQETWQTLTRLQNNLASAELNLRNTASKLANAEAAERNARQKVANAEEQEQRYSSLAGTSVPRIDYLNARSRTTDARDQLNLAQKQTVDTRNEIEAGRDRVQSLKQDVAIQKQRIAQAEATLNQAQKSQAMLEVRAPISGTIYNLKVNPGQAAIQSGQELLSILPEDANIVLHANLSNKDVGFIHSEQKVKIKFDTFHFQEFGTVDGTVEWISPNAVVDKVKEDKVASVFPTRIRLASNAIKVRGNTVQFTPGMTVRAEIVTRQRTILSFLLEPIVEQLSSAFSVR